MTILPQGTRIYLAGPEVFLPDPAAAGRAKMKLCEQHGFVGVLPSDPALTADRLAKHEVARRISRANESLMRSCRLLIANLTPFRGASADAGTVFEVGFMRALGRPVLGYTNTELSLLRRSEIVRAGARLSFDGDGPAVAIEDFDMAENLMIEIAIVQSGGTLARRTVPRGQEMTDLSGFEICLQQARAIVSRADGQT
jgi:nucleoside 2-deoxyribosyltransferase